MKAWPLKITRELSPQVTATTKYRTSYDSAFSSSNFFFCYYVYQKFSQRVNQIPHQYGVFTSRSHSNALPWKHTFTQVCERLYTYLSPYNLFLELHQSACFLLPWRLSFLLNVFQVSLSLQCILASLLFPGILKYLWSLKTQKLRDFYII